jgi:hypothetical protein
VDQTNAMDYRTVRAKAQRPTERQKKAAEGLRAGKTIKAALLDAGYAETTAKMGMRAVPLSVQTLGIKGSGVWRVGKGLSIDDFKYLALGRLAVNTAEGKDGGVMSAKTLGSHRELNLWTPESQIGLIVVNAPTGAGKLEELPKEEK